MSKYAAQIAALEETRNQKAVRMEEIGQKAADESRSMDDAESEDFDTLKDEIKRLDGDLSRYRELARMEKAAQAADANTAVPADDSAKGQKLNKGQPLPAQARNTQKLPPGLGFARFARVKLLGQMTRDPIENIAKTLYPGDDRLIAVVKAPVGAANTLSQAWAGDLINDGSVFADFVEWLRPRTVVGQIIDRLRRLPFDTPVLVQSSGGTASWVKEGNAKPVTSWGYTKTKLTPLTVAAIAAATKQQLSRASIDADMLLRDELGRAVGETIDTTFIDPSEAPVTDESPGSIFYDVTPLVASGDNTVIGVRCDIATMLNAHSDANLNFDGLFWLMSGRNAIALSQMTNEIGNLAYPTVTPTGGTLAGFPVFVSNYAPTDSDGSFVGLVKGSDIYYGDEGGIDVAMSDQASLIMDSAPGSNSITPTGVNTGTQALVSMFQTNSVAIRVERTLNWSRRRPQSVPWMSVNWDSCAAAES